MGWPRLELYYLEEEKLLRYLVIIIINLASIFALGQVVDNAQSHENEKAIYFDQDISDTNWVSDIAKHAQQMTIDNFINSFKSTEAIEQYQGVDADLRESLLKPRPMLQIFVSSSMGKELLKAYAKEASYYSGVLVFRGLPEGSFRKITDLVMDISDEQHPCAMQIDDEAFASFGVQVVPTIVLSKGSAIFAEQVLPSNFDKISGNIKIKAALELFAKEGELAASSKELLR